MQVSPLSEWWCNICWADKMLTDVPIRHVIVHNNVIKQSYEVAGLKPRYQQNSRSMSPTLDDTIAIVTLLWTFDDAPEPLILI